MIRPIYNAVYSSPIGELGIYCEENRLAAIDWLGDLTQEFELVPNDYTRVCLDCLDDYFHHPTTSSRLPVMLSQGTDFQKRVWSKLLEIPLGEAWSYGELAKQLNTSSRAIGQACRTNKIPILIPCHRIIARDGLGGFMGKHKRLDRKHWLLRHEGFELH